MTYLNYLFHLDATLTQAFTQMGFWVFWVIACVVFCETGLVVLPILPGDSLLFALGALLASREDVGLFFGVMVLLMTAAILGNISNYAIGSRFGHWLLQSRFRSLISERSLQKAHLAYEEHGAVIIIAGRFLPLFRTFIPFVAGLSQMPWLAFARASVLGAGLWVASMLCAGYFFGQFAVVKAHFSLIVFAIMLVSLLPAGVGYWLNRHQQPLRMD